jgi:hypothetical protein
MIAYFFLLVVVTLDSRDFLVDSRIVYVTIKQVKEHDLVEQHQSLFW